MKHMPPELCLHLQDEEWPFTYTDHERVIARAIVVDGEGFFHFMRASRDDEFGDGTWIETSGGGVEIGEDLHTAVRRELKEELGAEVEILCKLGEVHDYYNLIHRHNHNHYFLCRALSFGEPSMTPDEIEKYRLSPWKLSYEEAVTAYGSCGCTALGRVIAKRELPILHHAKKALDILQQGTE